MKICNELLKMLEQEDTDKDNGNKTNGNGGNGNKTNGNGDKGTDGEVDKGGERVLKPETIKKVVGILGKFTDDAEGAKKIGDQKWEDLRDLVAKCLTIAKDKSGFEAALKKEFNYDHTT